MFLSTLKNPSGFNWRKLLYFISILPPIGLHLQNKSKYSFNTNRRFWERPVISVNNPRSTSVLISRFVLLKLISYFSVTIQINIHIVILLWSALLEGLFSLSDIKIDFLGFFSHFLPGEFFCPLYSLFNHLLMFTTALCSAVVKDCFKAAADVFDIIWMEI